MSQIHSDSARKRVSQRQQRRSGQEQGQRHRQDLGQGQRQEKGQRKGHKEEQRKGHWHGRTVYHMIGHPEKNEAADHLVTPVSSVRFSIIQRRISVSLNSQFLFCQVQSKQCYDLAFKSCNPIWYFRVQGTMS